MGKNLVDMEKVIDKYFSKAIAGIHILPFFPSKNCLINSNMANVLQVL